MCFLEYVKVSILRENTMKNLLLGIIAINLTLITLEAHSDENSETVIGDIAMTEANHSEAFNQMKTMLGVWEGKLTQYTGSVIDTYSEFRLVSGGNTITEKLIEDGVEMLTTYADKNGQLIVKHYCALGTQPVFKASKVADQSVEIKLDDSLSNYHPEHHNYVNSIKWTVNPENSSSAIVDSTLYLDGELRVQQSVIKRVK
jgi:hypothetical protein